MTDNQTNNEQGHKCDCGYIGVKRCHVFEEDAVIDSRDKLNVVKKQVLEFTDDLTGSDIASFASDLKASMKHKSDRFHISTKPVTVEGPHITIIEEYFE